MEPTEVESAVNAAGEAAFFTRPLPDAPFGASLTGRRVVVATRAGDSAFRIAREVAIAAKSRGWLLVIEVEDGRVVRDTRVPIRGAGP